MPTPALTPERRAELLAQLAAIDLDLGRKALRKNKLGDAMRVLEARRDELLAAHDLDESDVMACEYCAAHVLRGDLGYRDADGVVMCAAHAPTYAASRDALEAEMKVPADSSLEPDEIDRWRKHIDDHIAAGGSLDDRILIPV